MEASTCFNLMRLSEPVRNDVLKKIFSETEGIGMNLMRITIGTSDFCPLPFYSYDDSETPDPTLAKFSTSLDELYIIPAIQAAMRTVKNSTNLDELLFFSSPWSGPAWMKTTGKMEGGQLNKIYMKAYSEYLIKYLEAYQEKYNIPISAMTVQNEPLQNDAAYPSTLLPPADEVALISNYIGPLLKEKNLSTTLWAFDHNWNTLYYPEAVLSDVTAKGFVEGVAFHGYRGTPADMTTLHDEFPDRDIFFSEGSTFSIRGAKEIVNIFRNWARSYSAWVTILDTDLQPNAGPFKPSPTMIQIDPITLEVKYNLEFFTYGHFSKYVKRGFVRISSEDDFDPAPGRLDDNVAHVAFKKGRSYALVLANEATTPARLQLKWNGLWTRLELPERSVATLTWTE